MRRLAVPERYDFGRTISGISLIVGSDPTVGFDPAGAWFATRTPDGPGTLHLARDGGGLLATAYGPGTAWLIERADAIAGLRDDLTGFDELATRHPLVRRLAREHSGLRFAATGRIFHHLVPAVLGQKVSGKEAHHSYIRLLRHFASEPAPGPNARLRLPPDPEAVAATPYWTFHPFGVEQKRADALRRVAAQAAALERTADAAEATKRMTTVPGIGVWTAAEVVRVAFGDPDAVSVGDYHLKNIVSYALAGEPRGDDARMLELLEPFAGQRGRVCQLLGAAGITAPRYGHRMPLRSFARF
jgi:3-methyladenine DNA glycosylase/8-oxoguanine DNA glycosylase